MSAFPGVSSYQSSSLGSKFVVIGVVCCQEMRRNALFHKVLPVLTKYFLPKFKGGIFKILIHDHTLIQVVIRLVPHGDFLLLDSAPQLAVNVLAPGTVYRLGVIPENLPDGMEQAVHRQDSGGQGWAVLPFQQDLGVGVPLLRRLGQPVDSLRHILGDVLALPVELAQQILGVGITVSADAIL